MRPTLKRYLGALKMIDTLLQVDPTNPNLEHACAWVASMEAEEPDLKSYRVQLAVCRMPIH